MQRKWNSAYFSAVSVILLSLMTLVIGVDAQAQIAFTPETNDNVDLYVMDIDGKNQQNLTNSPVVRDSQPTWYSPAFAVAPVGKQFTMWGWLKQVAR